MTETYPAELPERPHGWRMSLALHMNYGPKGKGGVYKLFDEAGREMPFTYQYRTGAGGWEGYKLLGSEDLMNWAALRAAWPGWLAKQREVAL